MYRRLFLLTAVIAALLPGCRRSDGPLGRGSVTRLNGLTIRFLDIGQGDSALVQWEDRAALIDGGPPESAGKLMDDLKRYGVTKIDWVIASHPHADHIGGLIRVVRDIPVAHFVDSGFNSGSPDQAALLRAIRDRKVDFRIAHEDQTLDLGDGVALYFFTPPDPLLENTDSDPNNNSIVARLMYGRLRILFTGDMESAERHVVYSHTPANFEGPKALRADVLKVAHHGSRNGTDAEFLRFVQPKYAIISCGKGNRYGHPNATALKALRDAGADVHRTDLEGDITLSTDGTAISIAGEHAPSGSEWTPGNRGGTHRSRSRKSADYEAEPAGR